MLIILSPAKSLNFEAKTPAVKTTIPNFLSESKTLVDKLKKLSGPDIEKLMKISPKLAELNWQRFQDFNPNFNSQNSASGQRHSFDKYSAASQSLTRPSFYFVSP